jgi:hypothetical protein
MFKTGSTAHLRKMFKIVSQTGLFIQRKQMRPLLSNASLCIPWIDQHSSTLSQHGALHYSQRERLSLAPHLLIQNSFTFITNDCELHHSTATIISYGNTRSYQSQDHLPLRPTGFFVAACVPPEAGRAFTHAY